MNIAATAVPENLEAKTTGTGSLKAILVKTFVIAVALFALLSPAWVVLHGMGYLNQAPPPYWQMNAGQGSSAQTSGPASLGGC